MLKPKKLVFIVCFLILLNSEKVESFSLFEISLMGIGAGLIIDQRFDNSLEYLNNYALKEEVYDKFHEVYQTIIIMYFFR